MSWLFQSQPLKVWSCKHAFFHCEVSNAKAEKYPIVKISPKFRVHEFQIHQIYRVTYNFSGLWIFYLRASLVVESAQLLRMLSLCFVMFRGFSCAVNLFLHIFRIFWIWLHPITADPSPTINKSPQSNRSKLNIRQRRIVGILYISQIPGYFINVNIDCIRWLLMRHFKLSEQKLQTLSF